MSFTAITDGEIATGEPVAATTQTKIQEDLNDHESRIQTLEIQVGTFPPIVLRVNGYYQLATEILKTTTNSSITITGVHLLIDKAGSAGTTEIDVKVKSGVGSFTSIFTTKPSVAFSSGDDAISTNAILDATKINLIAGDILALDITSIQTDGWSFLVRIDYTV